MDRRGFSPNMLAVAADRLRSLSNIRLVQLLGIGLHELVPNSFDLVYCTNVLAHLDEMDRWRYVQEAFRVLRPGGRLFIDNVDLESDAGWRAFSEGAAAAQQLERPPYERGLSTAAELTTYWPTAGPTIGARIPFWDRAQIVHTTNGRRQKLEVRN
jgi:SAM-dependent methyltransferase